MNKMNRYKTDLPYVEANRLYFIHRVGDPPDLVHPVACQEHAFNKAPMLFDQELAEVVALAANDAFEETMGVSFEACLLHEPNGPRQRELRVIGHEKECNHIYLRDPGKRVPQSEDDWDDEDTIGIHIKERDGGRHAFFSGITEQGHWCIRLKNYDDTPGEQLVYEDREKLHQDWITD